MHNKEPKGEIRRGFSGCTRISLRILYWPLSCSLLNFSVVLSVVVGGAVVLLLVHWKFNGRRRANFLEVHVPQSARQGTDLRWRSLSMRSVGKMTGTMLHPLHPHSGDEINFHDAESSGHLILQQAFQTFSETTTEYLSDSLYLTRGIERRRSFMAQSLPSNDS